MARVVYSLVLLLISCILLVGARAKLGIKTGNRYLLQDYQDSLDVHTCGESVSVEPTEQGFRSVLPKYGFQLGEQSNKISSKYPDNSAWSDILNLGVLKVLYAHGRNIPIRDKINLEIYDFDGVAFTYGIFDTPCQKQVNASNTYIKAIPDNIYYDELNGFLSHEYVHAWQYDGQGTAPGGLTEGIADYVRIKINLPNVNWNKNEVPEKWDQGYSQTGYFLDWVDTNKALGFVEELNQRLKDNQYTDDLFVQLTGQSVDQLFEEYKATFKN